MVDKKKDMANLIGGTSSGRGTSPDPLGYQPGISSKTNHITHIHIDSSMNDQGEWHAGQVEGW